MTATGHPIRDCAPYTIATLDRLREMAERVARPQGRLSSRHPI